MIYPVYSMYSDSLKAFSQPFFNSGDDVASEIFSHYVRSEISLEDRPSLRLFRIGSFDDQAALFIPEDRKLIIDAISISDIKESSNAPQ